MARRGILLLGISVSAVAIACSAILGVDDVGYPPLGADDDAGAGADAPNAPTDLDAGTAGDAANVGDAADAACDGCGIAYHDITDRNGWTKVNLGTDDGGVGMLTTKAADFVGAVFDDRFIYFVPTTGGLVVRYDTKSRFDDPMAWTKFSVQSLTANFAGGAFDGRYVFLSPRTFGTALAFDTQNAFDNLANWTPLHLPSVSGSQQNHGALFDEKFVYAVPVGGVNSSNGKVVRYEKGKTFASSPWSHFDVTTVNASAKGFAGGVVAGPFVYLVPYKDDPVFHANVARYDTRQAFEDKASWRVVDASTFPPIAKGYVGGVFDGRYVYLVPNDPGAIDMVARHDSTLELNDPTSWQTYRIAKLSAAAKGFHGAAFDGKNVYFVPQGSPIAHGMVVRHEPQPNMDTVGAWSIFDVTELDPDAKGFAGAAFDGQYIYLVPRAGKVVVRFDARTRTPLAPDAPHSFY